MGKALHLPLARTYRRVIPTAVRPFISDSSVASNETPWLGIQSGSALVLKQSDLEGEHCLYDFHSSMHRKEERNRTYNCCHGVCAISL